MFQNDKVRAVAGALLLGLLILCLFGDPETLINSTLRGAGCTITVGFVVSGALLLGGRNG